ncbi:adenine nucleotide alpha hydrolase family protein [Candidatus Bathyarchaeota archaeon]|nr:MAG: adenine nucleotide alpha hydrolase family protein [Candidatus Bathyarchaeota archaeon]
MNGLRDETLSQSHLQPLQMTGFRERYLKTVHHTIERYRLVEPGDCIFVALSGGKDSGSALYTLTRYVEERGVECRLQPFHINLGFPFSQQVEEIVKQQVEFLGLSLKVFHASDYGVDMERIAKLPRPICSSCGLVKRYLMNRLPRELGATKLATGHHADDFIVFFFKNLLGGNLEWSSKFVPKLPTRGKQLGRIRPLFFVGGEENRRFAEEVGLPHLKEDLCPYSTYGCGVDRSKRMWLEVIDYISRRQRGFRRRMMTSIMRLAETLSTQRPETQPLRECRICGEPTSGEICAFCRLLEAQRRVD